MIKDYFSLALRNITKRKLRSWLTMIGIFIGIAAVVSLISLGDGMKYAITSQFSSFGTDKLTIQAGGLNAFGPPGSGAVNKLTTDNVDAINRITGVKLAISRMMRMVKLEFNEEISYESATNLPEELDKRNLVLEVLNLDLVEGRHLKPTDKYKVVIGNAIVYKNKFSKAPKLGDNILIEDKQFQIVGILEASGNPMLSSIVIINDEILREILDLDDEVDLIAAQVKNQNEMDKIAEEVNKVMRDERDVDIGEEDFTVETPAQTLQSVNTILNVVQAVLVGIAAISLFVGGIGIMNTMYTSVLERTKEIGIMKAIGGTNRSVLMLFLVESGIIGTLGGIIGVILGVLLSKSVEIIAGQALGTSLLQARFSPTLIIFSLLFSFFVGTISGVFPAIQASKLKPVDALRQ